MLMVAALVLSGAGLVAQGSSEDAAIAETVQTLVARAIHLAKSDHGVDLCVCHDGVSEVEAILDRVRKGLPKGRARDASIADQSLVWGTYIGEVVRREHGDATWRSAPRTGGQPYWLQFHGPDSGERFEPVPLVTAVLRNGTSRIPLAARVWLTALDCHLE